MVRAFQEEEKERERERKARNKGLLRLVVRYWNEYNNHWWWWEGLFPFYPHSVASSLSLVLPVSSIACILDRCFTYIKERHGYVFLSLSVCLSPFFLLNNDRSLSLSGSVLSSFAIIVFGGWEIQRERENIEHKKWSPIECQVELARHWFN